mmetsp:Transcript_4171/g.8707  ORF Transcript_4171/g.8707 Transcript_4171/m.8707 type:complete len:480 (+) Transcript_4171:2-1441(+)
MISKVLLVAALLAAASTPSATSLSTSGLISVSRLRRQGPAIALSDRPTTLVPCGGAVSSSDLSPAPRLPRELGPITLGVFSQMLGEGIALSSLALYLTRLGATPVTVGLAISCFSVAQMTCAPLLVGLSNRLGRPPVLRICLAGAAASSLLIAFSGSAAGVIAGRTLAGVFAACVPVAQAGVTDVLPKELTALGLSRVSAAAQLGVVVGPAASALLQEGFAAVGLHPDKCLPAVFVMNAVFAVGVLIAMALYDQQTPHESVTEEIVERQSSDGSVALNEESTDMGILRLTQPMLRTITVVVGWTAILSNSIYGLFAPRFLGFAQPQLSATYSAAAALMVATQMAFPRLVASIGEHRACTLGILSVGTGIGGLSLVRVQPFHSLLYLLNRAGAAVADTATAALVARSSQGREARSRNLALLTSTRAAARIVSPLVSSTLFQMSCGGARVPGALPFVLAASCAMAVAPLPSLLKRAERKAE